MAERRGWQEGQSTRPAKVSELNLIDQWMSSVGFEPGCDMNRSVV